MGMFALHVLQLHTRRSAKRPGREASADALLGPLFFRRRLPRSIHRLSCGHPCWSLHLEAPFPCDPAAGFYCGHPCSDLTAAFCGHPCFYRNCMFARRFFWSVGCCTSASNVIMLKATHGRNR